MAIEIGTPPDGKVLEVHVSGKLTLADYKNSVPQIEQLIKQQGKVSMLFEMTDFHGWEVGAIWEDIKFDLKHFAHIDRLAMIGEKRWQKQMSRFCRPFTTARIRYFDHSKSGEARAWLTGIQSRS